MQVRRHRLGAKTSLARTTYEHHIVSPATVYRSVALWTGWNVRQGDRLPADVWWRFEWVIWQL